VTYDLRREYVSCGCVIASETQKKAHGLGVGMARREMGSTWVIARATHSPPQDLQITTIADRIFGSNCAIDGRFQAARR
jgi:hypothetical protein